MLSEDIFQINFSSQISDFRSDISSLKFEVLGLRSLLRRPDWLAAVIDPLDIPGLIHSIREFAPVAIGFRLVFK